MEHVPIATAVITKPATVQTPVVVEVKVTVRDEEAVGATDCVPWPSFMIPGLVKVTV
jgi:hypothetical protein